LERLPKRICRKSGFLLHNCGSSRTALIARRKTQVLEHSMQSPHLALCDHLMLPKLKYLEKVSFSMT
jgi:hypothetical protein